MVCQTLKLYTGPAAMSDGENGMARLPEIHFLLENRCAAVRSGPWQV